LNKRQRAQLTSGVTDLVAWCQRRRDTYCPGRAGPLGQLSAGQQAPTSTRRFVVFVAKGTASDIFVYRKTTLLKATRKVGNMKCGTPNGCRAATRTRNRENPDSMLGRLARTSWIPRGLHAGRRTCGLLQGGDLRSGWENELCLVLCLAICWGVP